MISVASESLWDTGEFAVGNSALRTKVIGQERGVRMVFVL